MRRAELRLGSPRRRAPRSDRGSSRLPRTVRQKLDELLDTHDRPPMRAVRAQLAAHCEPRGLPTPSRATLYTYLLKARPPSYPAVDLPDAVRRTLHNVDPDASVSGPELVQRAFNAGSVPAVSFASSLPWLCLYQAARRRGWRPKSRAMLEAVMRFRGI